MQKELDTTRTAKSCFELVLKGDQRTYDIFIVLPLEGEDAGGGLQEVAPSTLSMGILAYDKETKKIVDSAAIDAVDKILDLKKDKGPWEVIDYVIKLWYDKAGEEEEGVLIQIRDLKETRKDQVYGQTDDKNMDRRLILLFPLGLQHLLRKIYTAQELPFNKKFFIEFSKRYKAFQIPEKI